MAMESVLRNIQLLHDVPRGIGDPDAVQPNDRHIVTSSGQVANLGRKNGHPEVHKQQYKSDQDA